MRTYYYESDWVESVRISLVGAGDFTRVEKYTGLSNKDIIKIIEDLAKVLVDKGCEIVIIPNAGFPVEVAKKYKELGGKKVFGVVPVNDKKYGVKHIEPNLRMIDEKIEVNSWYDADGEIAASGDVCVAFGMSAGIMRDISVLKYHYKFLGSKTKLIMFENAMSQKLAPEVEEVFGDNLIYVNSVEELAEELK